MSKFGIFTAFHKNFDLPKETKIYIPIHAGKASSNLNLGMIGDDYGDFDSYKLALFVK